MTSTFLNTEELATLTGRKLKSHQIEALRMMGIAFFVNAIGRPVVARSAIEGGSKAAAKAPKAPVMPRLFKQM